MVSIEKIKFIHTADLHLDSPFIGLRQVPEPIFRKIKESTFTAFTRIFETAIAEDVDFLLISGDLFDHETRSLRSQVKLREGLTHLCNNGIQVYIIHGNHDHLSGDFAQISWPRNVHIFSKDVEMKPFQKEGKTLVHIYGFSYGQRVVLENMTNYYHMKSGAPFHIGMLHGNLTGSQDHDPYAPFTIEELLAKQFDYWALGHIHKRQVIHENPMILYPGNIQGRHSKEKGEKGCYVIELDKNKTTAKFVPASEVVWESIEVTIDDIETFDQLINKIQKRKIEYKLANRSTLLGISVSGSGQLHELLDQDKIVEEILEIINEEEENEQHFVWTVSCAINTTMSYDRSKLKNESHFIGDLLTLIDDNQNEILDRALMSMYKNRNVSRYLDSFDESDKKDIIERAEKLLLQQLLKD